MLLLSVAAAVVAQKNSTKLQNPLEAMAAGELQESKQVSAWSNWISHVVITWISMQYMT